MMNKTTLDKTICEFENSNYSKCSFCDPETDLRFSYQHFEVNKEYVANFLRYDTFIIVMSGSVELTINDHKQVLCMDEIMTLQLFSNVSFKALEDCYIFSFVYLVNKTHPCMLRKLNYTFPYHEEQPLRFSRPLHLSPTLRSFMNSLRLLLDRIPHCNMLYKNKGFEFGAILAVDYDEQSLLNFLYPLFRHDYDLVVGLNAGLEFFVTKSSMAEWMDMSLDDFEVRFKKSFNEDPQIWLDRQRIYLVRQYVINHKCTVNELIFKFSFCSLDHLSHFCQVHYNLSPQDFIDKYYLEKNKFPLF